LWTNEELRDRRLTSAVPFGGYLVAGDFEGYLHWFDMTTGRLVARNSLSSSGIVANPVATATHLYVYTRGGTLYALAAP
jgi:outer membrane protein assembly factor BamB